MSVSELLKALEEQGIELWFEGERLRFRAPKGALTAEQRASLVARKPEILAHLREEATRSSKTFPLSYAQKSLWFLHRQAPESAAYNAAMSARVLSPIDDAALAQGVQALVDRHATLRTTYGFDGTAPFQRVAGASRAEFEVHDASGASDEELRAAVEANYRRPFDLEHGPIVRVALYRRRPDDLVLLLVVHHIAVDGWSMLMLAEELLKLHHEAVGGPPANLARGAHEYTDYAAWQEKNLAGPEGDRLWAYWREKLAPPRARLELPTDRPAPNVNTLRGASRDLAIPPALVARLHRHAQATGATPFVFFLASFQALLFRLTGAEDVIVGTPTFGRNKAEYMQITGDFINTVPLRGRLSPEMAFSDLVVQLKTTVHEALDAGEFPLPLIVQRLHLNRDARRSPLFDTFFSFQRSDQPKSVAELFQGSEADEPWELSGVRVAPYRVSQQDGQFDLSLWMTERGGCTFKYGTDVFDASTIERLAMDYLALLEAIDRQPYLPLGALPEPLLLDAAAHFRKVLDGSTSLELPVDRPRAAKRPATRGLERAPLPGAALVVLRETSRAAGQPPNASLLAALGVLLSRESGQLDLLVGTAPRKHTAPILPVRVRVNPDAPFGALLQATGAALTELEARPEHDAELEAAFARARGAIGARAPSVRFAVSGPSAPSVATGDACELLFTVVESDQGASVAVDYDASIFDAATARRLAGHYRTVVSALADEPDLRVSRVPLLTAPERAELLARCRATCVGTPRETPVIRLFEEQVQATPGATAVIDGTIALSYRSLDRAANALAKQLQALGVGPGQHVAVSLERSCAVIVSLLAILRLGATYVPVDPHYPPERGVYVLEDACPIVFLTEEGLRGHLPVPEQVSIMVVDPHALASEGGDAPIVPEPDPDAIAYVLYTSGSTGRPKGVEVPNRALSNFLASMQHTPGLEAQDRLLSVTTISFDIAGLEIFLPLVTGACVQIVPREVTVDGARLARLIETSGATVMQATPATWRMLIESGWRGSPGLKILCGGEAMSRELANQLLTRAGSVWNMYGPTETTIWSTVHPVAAEEGIVPVGKPVDHTPVYVLDPQGELVPYGVTGEIYIGGAGVARGYLRRPELTASRFVPDPFAGRGGRMYRTGDAGRLRADGVFECLGRLDHQVKIRGHRIELGEIEAVMREHPLVEGAVVVAREFAPGDVRLVGYYVARSQALGARELRELCQRKLPKDVVPTSWIEIASIPLTPNGKTDTKALPAPDAQAEDDAERVPPRDALEAKILAIWESVLETRVASVKDRFFDIGGHSLLAVRLFARIEQETGVALALATLLENGTVEHLANCVREHRNEARAQVPSERTLSYLVPIRARGSRAPLFCVHGAGGNVLNFRDIGRHLSPDRPFYGVQAAGVDGMTRPMQTIEEMAEKYLSEVRAIQPQGPYYLSGYCGGGMIAYEIAQRLHEAGEQVAMLVLIDLYRPGVVVIDSRRRRWARTLQRESIGVLLEKARAKVEREVGVALRNVRLLYHLSRGSRVPYELRDHWLQVSFLQALDQYTLRPYAGKITVLRAREVSPLAVDVPPDLGWAPYALDGIVSHEVPGDHHSLTLEPNVQVLAAQLEACLRAAEGEVQMPSDSTTRLARPGVAA